MGLGAKGAKRRRLAHGLPLTGVGYFLREKASSALVQDLRCMAQGFEEVEALAMIYDPERALWRPNRRYFLFGMAAAIVAPSLPDVGFNDVSIVANHELWGTPWYQIANIREYQQLYNRALSIALETQSVMFKEPICL